MSPGGESLPDKPSVKRTASKLRAGCPKRFRQREGVKRAVNFDFHAVAISLEILGRV